MSQFKGYGTTTNCSSGADTTDIDIKDYQSTYNEPPIPTPNEPLLHIKKTGTDFYIGLQGPRQGGRLGSRDISLNRYDSINFDPRNFSLTSAYGLPMSIRGGAPPVVISEQGWIKAYDISSSRIGYIPIYYPARAEIQLKIGNDWINSGSQIESGNSPISITASSSIRLNPVGPNNSDYKDAGFNISLIKEGSAYTRNNSSYSATYSNLDNTTTNIQVINNDSIISLTRQPPPAANSNGAIYTNFYIPYEYTTKIVVLGMHTSDEKLQDLFLLIVKWT